MIQTEAYQVTHLNTGVFEVFLVLKLQKTLASLYDDVGYIIHMQAIELDPSGYIIVYTPDGRGKLKIERLEVQ